MHAEVVADILTFSIFLILLIYVWMRKVALQIFTPLLIFVIGILVVSVSDAVALTTSDPMVECMAGKFTAVGALISIAALFHALTTFPLRSRLSKLIPSVYIISGAVIYYLFLTPYMLYCHPVLGGGRGILWDSFLLWTYGLLLITTLLPGIRYFTLKIKVQKMQELLIFIGTALAVIYIGVAEVIPYFFGIYNYFTSIFALPIMGVFYIYSSVRYGMFIEPSSREKNRDNKMSLNIEDRKIVAIANTHAAYKVFRNIVSHEPGMIISVKPPNYIRENYNIEKTPILWITYFPGKYKSSIVPGRLHFEGMEAIINFVRKGGKILLFEGTEYLIVNFGRAFFAEFVESLRNIEDLKVILAVESPNSVEGLVDELHIVRVNVDKPKVILTKAQPPCSSTIIITTRNVPCLSNSGIIRLTKDFSVDKLIFEGIKHIEESDAKNVYLDCMDYIISVAGEKNSVNFLKDTIDIILMNGGRVYIRYTPRITESSLLKLFVDTAQ